jgi:hypothetical protein
MNGVPSQFVLENSAVRHRNPGGPDGGYTGGGVAVDSSGNLYGTTVTGGANGQGVIYQIAQ